MLALRPPGAVRIFTSTTALAPQASASICSRCSAVRQPSAWPSVQLRPYWNQQVPVTVASGRRPCERTSSSSAGVIVASQGVVPAAAAARRFSTKSGSRFDVSAASQAAPLAAAASIAAFATAGSGLAPLAARLKNQVIPLAPDVSEEAVQGVGGRAGFFGQGL